MKVFYFCTPIGVKILENLEIKVTRPTELNDPFEFLPYADGHTGDKETEKKNCDAFYKTAGETFLFLSFCQDFKCPRMWAQYAKDHSGLMFEFDLEETPFLEVAKSTNGFLRVDYVSKRVPWSECDNMDTEAFKKVSSRKGYAWSAEEEIRLMIRRHPDGRTIPSSLGLKDIVTDGKSVTLLPLTEACIASVTFGLRTSDDLKSAVRRLLENRFSKAKLFQAKHHDSDFTMTREPV